MLSGAPVPHSAHRSARCMVGSVADIRPGVLNGIQKVLWRQDASGPVQGRPSASKSLTCHTAWTEGREKAQSYQVRMRLCRIFMQLPNQ